MSNCNTEKLRFSPLNRRQIEVELSELELSSNGGVMLLRELDKHLGLVKAINRALKDPRDPRYIQHEQLDLLRQRIYGLCLGYEDLNDHAELRHDVALQAAVERDRVLGSEATLCRLEQRTDRQTAVALHEVLIDQFIASFDAPPKELILDFDATDDPVHGEQEGRFYHGYYRNYCFLPLYVFADEQLLVSYLRPSNIDGAKHAWAILSLLVKRLRREWPAVVLTFRGDGGFCRWRMMRWCDRHDVGYIIGLSKNSRLQKKVAAEVAEAARQHQATGEKVRQFKALDYAADSWDKPRRVIAKIEHLDKGPNLRFVVTNLKYDTPQKLYDEVYCARGEMENHIKEQQLEMFADRTSCHRWWPNQFRLLLSSFAYVLMERLRTRLLHGTRCERMQVGTLRLKLLKVATLILRNTRRIRLLMAQHFPFQDVFKLAIARLTAG